jgi:glycosyltransferase involved in cell wall biosynthesis
VRKELGIPAGAPVLVSVSRLFHWKGQVELLRSFALARREVPEAWLLIVGEEDRTAGADRPHYLAELKALAAELGVADRAIFTGKRSDVARVLAASDIFSMPSFEEPFGLVYTEAMAMKRPVLALNNGGTPEVVDHERSGLLSAPKDLEGLARNMVTLMRDPALRARMGEHGREQVLTRFAPARMARDFERIYAALAGAA